MALFENFTYAGIDATAEEAWLPAPPDPRRVHSPREAHHSRALRYCHSPVARFHRSKRHSTKTTWL